MYGYQDSSEVASGSGGGKFGLNSGVVLTKFEFNPNAGAAGAPGNAIDLTIQVGDKEYRKRFFPVGKIYAKGGGELTDTTTEEYKEAKTKATSLLNATLTDIVKCFVSEEDLKAAFLAPIASFKDYAEILQRLVQTVPNWDKKPLDTFLCYQWTISGENDKTYLELPKDVKHGTFLIPTQGAGFTKIEGDSIKYANAEGLTHPFKRSEWYAKSAFGVQTLLNPSPASSMGASSNATNW